MIKKTELNLCGESFLHSKVRLLNNLKKDGSKVETTSFTSECSTTITSF
jgi:hypothetical protein